LRKARSSADGVFAEVAALGVIGEADGLVLGDGRIILAAAEADAGGEALLRSISAPMRARRRKRSRSWFTSY